VVGFTTGSRGKVPGKTCEKRTRNNNNNNNNSRLSANCEVLHYTIFSSFLLLHSFLVQIFSAALSIYFLKHATKCYAHTKQREN
jgi:hypothetical protein